MLKELGFRLLSASYELIFKEKMGNEARKLILSTSYVGIGMVFGILFSVTFSILGARILGPTNFGNLGLVTTVGTILSLSVVVGPIAMIKYGAETQNHFARVSIVSASYILIALLTAASTCVYVLFSASLSQLFGLSTELFFFALFLTVTSTFYALTTNTLRVFFKMKTYALLNAAQSVILLVVFLAFISNGMKSWESAAYSYYLSYAVIGFILVIYLRDYIKLRFERSWAKKITHYSLLALPGAVAISFMGVDRILINKFLTTSDVGIYNAYFLPSITTAVTLWTVINVAFFPYASKSADRLAILHQANKAAPFLAASLTPSVLLLTWIFFVLYGRQYPFSWEIALFFAIAATMAFFYQFLSWLMASEGMRGAKVNTLSSIIALIVLFSLDVVLIPLIGLLGAAATLVFAYLIAALYLLSKRRVLSADRAPLTLKTEQIPDE
ncbi:MAG: oligosaccharide flippase family protein [Halobacteriota archaeon]